MKKSDFERLLTSVREMDDIASDRKAAARVTRFPEPKVKTIREQTGLNQNQFAMLIGVSKRTLENWEQGRRRPTGAANALLRIMESDPEYAVRALYGRGKSA